MKRKKTLLDIEPTLIRLALLTTAIRCGRFRAMDVLNYVDKYSISMYFLGERVHIQPIQVDRIIESLSQLGYAKLEKVGTRKVYELFPSGIHYIVETLINRDQRLPADEIMLILDFLARYKDKIIAACELGAESHYRISVAIDEQKLLKDQIELMDKTVAGFKAKIFEMEKLISWLAAEYSPNVDLMNLVSRIPRNLCSDLGAGSSLRITLASMPEDQVRYEIESGYQMRLERYLKVVHDVHVRSLEELKSLVAIDDYKSIDDYKHSQLNTGTQESSVGVL